MVIGQRACRADGDYLVVFDHYGGVLDDPERSLSQGGDVGDQLTDVVDHQGHEVINLGMMESSSEATSIETWVPSTTTGTPPTTR